MLALAQFDLETPVDAAGEEGAELRKGHVGGPLLDLSVVTRSLDEGTLERYFVLDGDDAFAVARTTARRRRRTTASNGMWIRTVTVRDATRTSVPATPTAMGECAVKRTGTASVAAITSPSLCNRGAV